MYNSNNNHYLCNKELNDATRKEVLAGLYKTLNNDVTTRTMFPNLELQAIPTGDFSREIASPLTTKSLVMLTDSNVEVEISVTIKSTRSSYNKTMLEIVSEKVASFKRQQKMSAERIAKQLTAKALELEQAWNKACATILNAVEVPKWYE